MRKVLLLSGSPNAKGNTMAVLGECAKAIESAGVETEIVSLAGMDIRSCVGCRKCAGQGRCVGVAKDGLNEIIEKIKPARGLIVAAPVYYGTARAALMAAVQRIAMVASGNDRFLAGKIGGPIAVARRGGHTTALHEMMMFYLISDMTVAGSTYWNMVFGRTPGEALEDEEGIRTVLRFGENVARLVDSAESAPEA